MTVGNHFQANNIVAYNVEPDKKTLIKCSETGDEKEVVLNGLSGSDSQFYKTVSSRYLSCTS